MTNIYIMNIISNVDALLKIVLMIRTDGTFTVDTLLKLDISSFSSRTHIRNVWSVFLQKDLSQQMKVCFGNQVFSRELSKIMFSLMKIHRTFLIVISIPRVKSKSKNPPYLRHTICVSAHAWGETVTKLVWRARQCFPNQRLLQALSLRLGRSWSLGGDEGVVKFLWVHTSGKPYKYCFFLACFACWEPPKKAKLLTVQPKAADLSSRP